MLVTTTVTKRFSIRDNFNIYKKTVDDKLIKNYL
jgi:hypothetical protein